MAEAPCGGTTAATVWIVAPILTALLLVVYVGLTQGETDFAWNLLMVGLVLLGISLASLFFYYRFVLALCMLLGIIGSLFGCYQLMIVIIGMLA